jgi:SpoIID/LytB domain protein
MRLVILMAVAVAVLPATASAADLVVHGRGWGHGVGMSQYGAYGYARDELRDHRFILGHYYAGSGYSTARGARMRVRTNLVAVVNTSTGRTRARLLAPVRVSGGSSTALRGRADNGLRNGIYRGRMLISRDGPHALLAVNSVALEHYLYGVVPAEMPASWASEALKAQAVVARSYALRSRRPGAPYDVFADVRSQVYRGVPAETSATNAAVRATRAAVVTAGGQVAQTFFFSTSGGRTAGNEEVFGATPISYLRAVDDPHDDISPYHTWTARFGEAEAKRKLRSVTAGELRSLRVASRTASGRAATVLVRGSAGDVAVGAGTIQRLLGLRSVWITRTAGP